MKKYILILVVLALVVAAFPATSQPSQAQEPVEITFVHVFSDAQDFRSTVVQEIADEFMALHPNVTVKVEAPSSSYEELFNGSLLAAEQGNAPNIVQVEEGLTQIAVDSGYFLPISDMLTEEQAADLEDYLPQVTAFFSVDGKLWGLPWNTSTPIFYYNKDAFRAAGLDPEAPPATFEEVLAACEAIMAAEIEGLVSCANWPLVSWFVEQWVAMQNAPMVNNDNGRSGRATEMFINSPEALNIVNWWKEMADSGYYTYTGQIGDYNGEALIFLGKTTAMHINSTAGVTLIKQFSEAQGFELGIAPLPLPNAEATNGMTVGGASVFITGGYSDAETQAALDFAIFLTNTENGAKWHQGTGYFPNRQSTIDLLTEQNWFEENPDFSIGLNQMLNSQTNVATAGMVVGPAAEVRNIVAEAIQTVIDGGEDPAASMDAAKGRIDPILQEYSSFYE